ncbi:hypothetical protein AT15_08685 [Kosmotoga arenicorallina S304]|uniref:HTH arsR-type domain-containing protein n=1 Tax=Kosmotoga arenicorallina S304 TaxID=1453497 RepID=A0A176K1Q0_9BACT|nr:metalloregulator ArsR/SmtB family transcription factor [Kosmotoga arenicorallina]OAA31041.1 hypothetical protein AT15_08685 [Kosmotoga arenicorallina S304]
MKLRLVWIELGELIAISKLITGKNKADFKSLSDGMKFRIDVFERDISATATWNTKTLVSAFSELGEIFLIFASESFEDGDFITLEKSIDNLNAFEENGTRFFSSVIDRFFRNKQQLLKSYSRDKFLDFLQNQKVLSRSSTWFLSQLLIFPQHTKEIFKESLEKLLQSYERSGLRKEVTCLAHKTLKMLNKEHSRVILIERLRQLSGSSFGGYPVLSIQHLLPNFAFDPVKLDEGMLFLLGNLLSAEKSKYRSRGSEVLKEFLKDLSDKTRFCILKVLSKEPMYVAQLAEHCGLSKATISHHLSELGKLEILEKSNDGRKVYYSLNKENLKKIIEEINNTFLKTGDNQ